MAVTSKVDICNMALTHLGKPFITDVTETGQTAVKCNFHYDKARRALLVKSPWTFARRIRSLSLLTANDLSDLWEFHYDLPSDMIALRRLLPQSARVDRNEPPIPSYIEEGTLYSNEPLAKLFYTPDSTDTAAWSSGFDDALALGLALRLAPDFTRRTSDIERLRNMYTDAIRDAIQEDAAQEPATYTFYDGGYVDARDAGSPGGRRQSDGSTIWE